MYLTDPALRNYATESYSQEGEDMILRSVFEGKAAGFYVDVGAHHPARFSNTYYFYKRGWTGVNIDAMPGSMRLFEKLRPKDTNLEAAISDRKKSLTYYMFNEPALNSFSEDLSAERDRKGNYRITNEIEIETLTLAGVLDTYLSESVEIDFLSVDVEGLELEVLKSNDWSRYKPKIVLIEHLNSYLPDLFNCEVYEFLVSKGYSLFAKTLDTVFYKLQE